MQQSFPIGIRNGLVTAEHRQRMGMSIWEFLWLVDHTTDEYQDGTGEIRGKVLGGSVITAVRMAEELGISPDTVRDSLQRLDLAGYISRKRATNGYRIEIRNSKKWRRDPPVNGPPQTNPANRRTGELESWRVGEKSETPILRNSETPVASIDNAEAMDNAEAIALIESRRNDGANAAEGSAGNIWTQAVAQSAKNHSAGFVERMRQCSILQFDGQALRMVYPDGLAPDPRFQSDQLVMRQYVRDVTGRSIAVTITYAQTEARAGP